MSRSKSSSYQRVRDVRRKKSSSTPGKAKGLQCQREQWKTLMVSARGYKHPEYAAWCEKISRPPYV